MEKHVETQLTANTLDQGDRTRLSVRTRKPGLLAQVCCDALVDDAEYVAHDLGTASEQETQWVLHVQHALTHRLPGKYIIDQLRGSLGHTAGAAARAETATFATESEEVLGRVTVTAHAQETLL